MAAHETDLPESGRKWTVGSLNVAEQPPAELAGSRSRTDHLEPGTSRVRPERPVTERAQTGVDE